jgi:predicted lipoprotein with Yx(FWY)xxD motif
VDKVTGARIPDDKPGGLAVWAYRGRPVYTFAGDKAPGDAYGDGVEIFFQASYEMLAIDNKATYF